MVLGNIQSSAKKENMQEMTVCNRMKRETCCAVVLYKAVPSSI